MAALLRGFLVLFLAQGAFSQLKWVKFNPSSALPSARSDSSIGFDANTNKAVIFGGRSSSGVLGDTWIFDLTTKIWSKVNTKSIPEPRFSMVFGSKNGSFYISTGEFTGSGPNIFYNDVVKFEIASQNWTKIEPKTSLKPEKRYGSAGGIHPDSDGLYVTHGFSTVRYSNTLRFDLKTEKWETKFDGTNANSPSYPLGRCLHSCTMSGPEELMLFGGCIGVGPCPAGDTWKYDANKNYWTKLTQFATPSSYSAMAMLPSRDSSKRRVVLYGGRESSGSTKAPANEIIILDPETNSWTKKNLQGDVPAKRFGHVMATTPNGILMFGGKTVSGSFLNDLWLLQSNMTETPTTPPGNATEAPTTPQVNSTEAPTTPQVNSTEAPTTPQVNSTEAPTTPQGNATEAPTTPQVNATEAPTTPQVNSTEAPTTPQGNATETPTTPQGNATETPITPQGNMTETPTTPQGNMTETPTTPQNNVRETPTTGGSTDLFNFNLIILQGVFMSIINAIVIRVNLL